MLNCWVCGKQIDGKNWRFCTHCLQHQPRLCGLAMRQMKHQQPPGPDESYYERCDYEYERWVDSRS